MKLEKPLYVVCDANGDFKGLFSEGEHAHKAAKFHAASLTEVTEVLDSVPEEIVEWFARPIGAYISFMCDTVSPTIPVKLLRSLLTAYLETEDGRKKIAQAATSTANTTITLCTRADMQAKEKADQILEQARLFLACVPEEEALGDEYLALISAVENLKAAKQLIGVA